MVEPALDAPLSPELVLVSPDLKARALVEERIARPRPYLVPPLDEIVPLQPEAASLQSDPAPPESLPVPPAPIPASPPPPEWHLTVGAATLIALAAILVFGIGLAVGRFAITASSSESAAPSTAVPVAAPAETATQHASPEQAPAVPVAPSLPTTAVPARPKSSSQPSPAAVSAAHAVRPVPNGGYILPEQRGRFRLSSDGQTILDFTLATSCAGPLTLPPIDVGSTGTFAFTGQPGGSPPGTTARVRGRFVTSAEARGTIQVSGSACRLPSTTFVAQLS